MVSGYIFWFIISKMTTTDTLGSASTMVSLATIFSMVSTIGVPTGVQRFLGKIFSEQKIKDAGVFVKSSFAIVTAGLVGCIAFIFVTTDFFHNIFQIDHNLMLIFVVIIVSTSIYNLLRSIIIASLKTKMLPGITIFSATLKIILGVILVLMGFGSQGITVGFALFPVLAAVLFYVALRSILKTSQTISEVKFKSSVKGTLSASLASWIPTLVTTIGSQLGTIVVFGSQGASHAGIYFIAFSIFTAVSAITSVLLSISYPVLSGMQDGRKTFAWRVTRISLIGTLPISFSFIFYSHEIMRIFGAEYANGTFALQILLLSSFPAVITSGINSLVYSRGKYNQVMVLGLAASAPRVLLYFILVPLYGSTGAGMSYFIGTLIGFFVAVFFAKTAGLKLYWKEALPLLLIPAGLGFVFSLSQINYVIGIILICVISCLLFMKMKLLARDDIRDSIGSLPPRISNPALKLLYTIGKKIDKNY